ncbi:major facilitator superfamily protein [Tothia fuscella]|uniref:Major facilitator superfamily protein n=1 Tax=Tothia fuscella TaxID=1048955 RepID=A0A9P4U399_9PEZI|nr:major facilitator superfamily protein [Tothia fuscella]
MASNNLNASRSTSTGSSEPQSILDVTNKTPYADITHTLTTTSASNPNVLRESDVEPKLGFSFSSRRKWWIIFVIFLVQTSMNFNASVYGNAVHPIMNKYKVSQMVAVAGQGVFLIAYAFGCELWAPWSEEKGRWWVLQMSLGLVNLWQIPCALAPWFPMVVVFRALGGLSSAGGSVTLGMVADMWHPHEQQFPVAFVVLSSVGGSIFGPVLGGFIEKHLDLQWNFWIQLLFGATVQLIHFFTVEETMASCIVTKEAAKRRKAGETEIRSVAEVHKTSMTWKDISKIWIRPFRMLFCEPVVLFLSLLSGFSDALIFTFLDAFGKVYRQWNFDSVEIGFTFLPIGLGYLIAYAIWMLVIVRNNRFHKAHPDTPKPAEHRLKWLMWTAPCLPIGMLAFAWTSTGLPMNWIVPMLFSVLIGIANFAIYGATIDYMVAVYGGKYSACATGGNGFSRDFLAGVAAFYASPLYSNLRDRPLQYASTLLGCMAFLLIIPVYIFYHYGPQIYKKSKYAQEIKAERERSEAVLPKTETSAPVANWE